MPNGQHKAPEAMNANAITLTMPSLMGGVTESEVSTTMKVCPTSQRGMLLIKMDSVQGQEGWVER